MYKLNALPRFLSSLSLTLRLCIAFLCMMLCVGLFMLLFRFSTNPSIMVIPVAVVAWMFRRRGMLLCIVIIVIALLIFFALYYPSFLRDPRIILSFLSGGSALVVLGLLVSSQRDWFDRFKDGQLREMEVKEQQQLLNKLKDQFILNVNHELRTPLTGVYGYLELLLERNNELDEATRANFLRGAIYSCEELQALINNVLGAVEMIKEQDYCQVEVLNVGTVVREVVEHFDPKQMVEHQVSLQVPDYLFVNANAQYMRQVLRNLLSNALKYTPSGSPVHISAALHGTTVQRDRAAPEIGISVKDAGPGIPPDEFPLLFGQFVRLKRDLMGAVRGTGLGLYVSKQLVEAMGGRIWVESTGLMGEGSSFCFTLPCVPLPDARREVCEPQESFHPVFEVELQD